MLNEKLESLNNARKRRIEKDDDADTIKSVIELPTVSNRNRITQIQPADSIKNISVEGIDNSGSKTKVNDNLHNYITRSKKDLRELKFIENNYGGVYIGDAGLEMSLPNQICANATIHESRVVLFTPANDEQNQIVSESIIENRCSNVRTRGTEESEMDHTISKNMEEDLDRIEVVDDFPESNKKMSQNSEYCHDFLEESLNVLYFILDNITDNY